MSASDEMFFSGESFGMEAIAGHKAALAMVEQDLGTSRYTSQNTDHDLVADAGRANTPAQGRSEEASLVLS